MGQGDEVIESMTEIPIRVRLDNMTADSQIVDFDGWTSRLGLLYRTVGIYCIFWRIPITDAGLIRSPILELSDVNNSEV